MKTYPSHQIVWLVFEGLRGLPECSRLHLQVSVGRGWLMFWLDVMAVSNWAWTKLWSSSWEYETGLTSHDYMVLLMLDLQREVWNTVCFFSVCFFQQRLHMETAPNQLDSQPHPGLVAGEPGPSVWLLCSFRLSQTSPVRRKMGAEGLFTAEPPSGFSGSVISSQG